MNDEQGGEVVDGHRESAVSDSSSAAVASDSQEDVRPPDSKKFQTEMDEILERIREFEAKLKSLEKQMSCSAAKVAVSIDREKLNSELQGLRAQREKVIEERKQHDLELKGLNMQVQKKNDACTKLQAGVRYKSEARTDEAVRRLEHQMQAQQLTLSEEKRLVAEIDTLKRSKRNLNDYLALKQLVDQLRNRQKKLRAQRDACVKRINGLKSREEEIKNLLDSDVTDGDEEAKTQHLEQMNEIDVVKKELDELHIKKRDLRANLIKEKNEYYSAIREMRSLKQKEELARKKQERLAMLKEVASNRGKQRLYEKEKALCDTLMGHLEKLHTNAMHLPDLQVSSSPDKEPVLSPGASADFSKSGGEGTFLRRKSATDDLTGVFAGVSRTPRRGSRKGRRSSAKEVPRKLNLHKDVLEQLLALNLTPPSTAADIPKLLEELQEKKEFYESAGTSSTVLPPPNNDPMSPITEEGAPEFPSTFKNSSESENPGENSQATNSLAVEDKPRDDHGHSHVNQNEVGGVSSTSSKVEEMTFCELSADNSNSTNLNNLVQETEVNIASLEKTDQQADAASDENSVLDTKAVVSDSTCNCQTNSGDSANSSNEPHSEVPDVRHPNNEDAHVLVEAMTNSVENNKGSHVSDEKITHSVDHQMHSKAGIIPKESGFFPDLQNHSSFRSSSPCNSGLLLDENGLEDAFDRNSLNEGGSLVKMQYEKCPA